MLKHDRGPERELLGGHLQNHGELQAPAFVDPGPRLRIERLWHGDSSAAGARERQIFADRTLEDLLPRKEQRVFLLQILATTVHQANVVLGYGYQVRDLPPAQVFANGGNRDLALPR